MNDETLKLLAYIEISSYRTKTLKSLKNENKTPTQIAKDSDIRVSHISKVLRELKDCELVECINEEDRRNRIYRLTLLGQNVVKYLD